MQIRILRRILKKRAARGAVAALLSIPLLTFASQTSEAQSSDSTGTTSIAASNEFGPPSTSIAPDDVAVAVRKSYGLASSLATVRAANTDIAASTEKIDGVNIRLTAAEKKSWSSFATLREGFPTISSHLASSYPEQYAGMWTEGLTGVIGLKGDAQQAYAEALALAPPGSTLILASADYSMLELESAYAAVTSAYATLIEQGIRIEEAATDTVNNRIQIDIDPLSDAGAESKLLAQFGPTLHVTRIQLPSSAQYAYRQALYPHLRAGQAIANGSEVCTAGFNLRSSDGNLWDVTAGHCSRGGGSWYEGYSSSGVSVGPEHSTSRSGSGCDCMLIGPISSGIANNYVYLAPNSSLAVSSSALKSNVYAGDHVGFSGWAGDTTGYGHVLVGQIQYVDVNHTYSDGSGTFYHMTSVAYPAATDGTPNCTIPGDSGGPWYTLPPSGPNLALGVHSGGVSPVLWRSST